MTRQHSHPSGNKVTVRTIYDGVIPETQHEYAEDRLVMGPCTGPVATGGFDQFFSDCHTEDPLRIGPHSRPFSDGAHGEDVSLIRWLS